MRKGKGSPQRQDNKGNQNKERLTLNKGSRRGLNKEEKELMMGEREDKGIKDL